MPLKRFLTDTATIWTATGSDPNDPWGGETWTSTVIQCAISEGGQTQRDQNGVEFTPGKTIWTDTAVTRGSRILPGTHSDAAPPEGVETIRKVQTWTPHPRHQGREYALYTG